MTIVLEIIKKEILDQLMTLRLTLSFLLVLVMMIAGTFLFQGEYERQTQDYSSNVSRNLAELARRASASAPLFEAFSWNDQFIYRRPNPAGFIAEGHDKDLPNVIRMNAFRLDSPEFALRGNPLLWRFENLDWSYIVSVILSFAAVVFVYDAVNGEKKHGTLRLMMSQPVPRASILLGKYLSAMIVLVVPLVAGALIDLAIIAYGGGARLEAGLLRTAALSIFLSVLCLSIFALLGLLLSALSKTPVVSLVSGLLIWVFLVIVVPAAGNLAARGLMKIPSQDQVEEDAGRAYDDATKSYNQLHPHPDNWIQSGKWSPGEPLRRAFEVEQASGRVHQDYEDLKLSQLKLGRRIASFSPTVLLAETLERIVDSGIAHYESFQKAARRYQQDLASYVDSKYPLNKVYPVDRNSTDRIISQMKLDFASIPKFEDRSAPASEASDAALRSGAILALINVVLFASAFVSFLRYDVR